MKKFISLLLIALLVVSLTACGGKTAKAKNVDVNAVFDSVSQHLPEMFYPDEVTMLNFLGIKAEDCKQYKVAVCAEGLRADELWVIEAKDEAAMENLKKMANSRIEAKLDETESYVPDQYVIVQKAAVITNGLYLSLIISPDVDTMKTAVEAAFQ